MAKLEVLVVCRDSMQVVKQCDTIEYGDDGVLELFDCVSEVAVPTVPGEKVRRSNRIDNAKLVGVFAAGAWLYVIPKDLASAHQLPNPPVQGQQAPAGYPNQGQPAAGYPNQDPRYQGQAAPAGYPNQGQPAAGYPNQGNPAAGYPNQNVDPRTGQPIGQADQLGNYPNQPNQNVDPRTGQPIV